MQKNEESQAMTLADENTALQPAPDFISGGTDGTEHITKDDIQMPRLAIAQKMSPQIDEEKADQFIPGLKIGDLFDTLTGRPYGKGPLDFVIVRADPPRWIEFYPREAGGGVKDMDVRAGDPRTQFSSDANGKSVPPAATKFYDFIIMLLPSREVIALSLKSTGLRVARELNGQIKRRNKPIFAGRYSVSTTSRTNSKGTFSVYVIKNVGWVPDAATYEYAKGLHDALKGKTVVIQREPGDDSFGDPAGEGGGSAGPEM